jgi:hypothetical protein
MLVFHCLCHPYSSHPRRWRSCTSIKSRVPLATACALLGASMRTASEAQLTPLPRAAEESAKRRVHRRHRVYGNCLRALRPVPRDEGLSR